MLLLFTNIQQRHFNLIIVWLVGAETIYSVIHSIYKKVYTNGSRFQSVVHISLTLTYVVSFVNYVCICFSHSSSLMFAQKPFPRVSTLPLNVDVESKRAYICAGMCEQVNIQFKTIESLNFKYIHFITPLSLFSIDDLHSNI